MTNTTTAIATALDRKRSRSARRFVARLARMLVGSGRRWPGRVQRRLRQIVEAGPPRISVFGASVAERPRALLVSNDLSASGAPKLLHEIALMLLANGWSVTVLSPLDGAFREPLVAAGAAVIVDPALEVDRSIERGASPLLAALALVTDILICNTIDTFPAVSVLAGKLPTLWYIHEVSLLRHRLATAPGVAEALRLPTLLWAGSELPAAILREVRKDVAIVPYGLDPLGDAPGPGGGEADRPMRVAIFGSYEPRKGQDLAVAAMASLPPSVRAGLQLTIYGRVLFPDFHASIGAAASPYPEITIAGELGPDAYARAVLNTDAVLVSSRDDTLPLVSLDALGAGRVLMCTATTGTSAALRSGESGFVAEPSAEAIAAMLTEAVARRLEWPAIGQAGRAVFAAIFSKAAFAERLNGAVAALQAATPR